MDTISKISRISYQTRRDFTRKTCQLTFISLRQKTQMSSKILNLGALALSGIMVFVSVILDVKNRKTAGFGTPNGVIGLILRISMFTWSIESAFVYLKAETYVIDNMSLAEQRVGINPNFTAAQATISLAVMCLFGIFTYYWVSVSALMPQSKLLGNAKKMIDNNPLMVPIGLIVYYVIYLGFFFGPLFIWNGQILRYTFWRALIQAVVQIILGLFLLPVLLYLVYALVRYIATKSIAKSGETGYDKVTLALIRIIFTNIVLICFLILAPATNLVLDRTLLFQEISLSHPVYSKPATTMMGAPQTITNLSGFFVSLIFLGKYITVKQRSTSGASQGKTNNSERSQVAVKASVTDK
ncbi:hypothetical protein BC833DRAFT_652213 [Globomyces pollinis-pini]|nr:hypothetical protein BC833DRAFT_652213 [Globomyces pollinis-pini]